MEQLIEDVEAYAVLMGVTPQKVLRDAIGSSWVQWANWKAGVSSPTLRNVDRLRAYMRQNLPEGGRERGAA